MFDTEYKVSGKLVRWMRPHTRSMGLLVLIRLLEFTAEVIGISLFIPFLSSLDAETFTPETDNWFGNLLGSFFLPVPESERTLVIALCIFGFIVLRSALSYAGSVLTASIDQTIDHTLRTDLMHRLLRGDMAYVESARPGDLINTLENVLVSVSGAIWTLLGLITDFIMVLVFTVVLMLLSWELTLFITVALGGISLVVKLLTSKAESLAGQSLEEGKELVQQAMEVIDGMRTIRTFVREDEEEKRFEQTSRQMSQTDLRLQKLSALVEPVAQLLAGTLLIVVLFTALGNPENLSMVLVFIFILYRLHPQVMELDDGRYDLVAAAPEVMLLAQMEDEGQQHLAASGTRPFSGLQDNISFESVNFYYPSNGPEHLALQDFSVRIKRGQRVAFVGPSGSGKSTVINLLLRFYQPQQGEIRVDGVPLSEFRMKDWRERMAVVSQEAHMFSMTIRDNIAYGHPSATDSDIVAAARKADAHEFISALPRGYDTLLGTRGLGLSGGQRQRIALARALLKGTELLILDEATNALDSLSESVVLDSVRALGTGCTVIYIAHRLSTITHADQIIVLESGKVLEQGDARELLDRQSLFARLYEQQKHPEPGKPQN